jgi:hypothetical protein
MTDQEGVHRRRAAICEPGGYLAARENATIEDGAGNNFGVGKGRSVSLGVFLRVGREEDISNAARQIGKEESPLLFATFGCPGKSTMRAVFHQEVYEVAPERVVNSAYVIFRFRHGLDAFMPGKKGNERGRPRQDSESTYVALSPHIDRRQRQEGNESDVCCTSRENSRSSPLSTKDAICSKYGIRSPAMGIPTKVSTCTEHDVHSLPMRDRWWWRAA